jgi:hypothetical protein
MSMILARKPRLKQREYVAPGLESLPEPPALGERDVGDLSAE